MGSNRLKQKSFWVEELNKKKKVYIELKRTEKK